MKKTLSIVLVLAVCLAFMPPASINPANAASVRLLEVYDDFNGAELNSEYWVADGGAEYDVEYSALRLNSLAQWGSQITLQKQKLSKDLGNFTLSFEISRLSGTSWTSMFLGCASEKTQFYSAKYMLNLSDGGRVYLSPKKAGETAFDHDNRQALASSPFVDGSATGGNVAVMEFVFTKNNNDDLYSIAVSWGKRGEAIVNKGAFANVDIAGNMGFSVWTDTVVEIYNFAIVKDDNTEVFSDDFSSGSISFPADPSSQTNWRGVIADSSKAFCGSFGRIAFNEANGKLTYINQLEHSNKVETAFELVYDVAVDSMAVGNYIGSGFGLLRTQDDADSVNFVGMQKRLDDMLEFALIKNGVVTSTAQDTSFSASGTVRVKFVSYYDNTLAVFVDGQPICSFTNLNTNGYMCVASIAIASAENNLVNIDNLSLDLFVSQVSTASDTSKNFTGIKEYEDFGEMISEHYINKRAWVMYGAGVKLPSFTSQRYLQFVDAGGDVGFGPKVRYSDSIVRFDFTVTHLPIEGASGVKPQAPFGLSFGREYPDAYYHEAPALMFTRSNGRTLIAGYNMVGENGETSVPCDLNVFADTGVSFTCMVVLSNRTARLYLKKTADPSSEFKLRATFVDANTYGYIAVTLDSFNGAIANFNLTNFSVTNIEG